MLKAAAHGRPAGAGRTPIQYSRSLLWFLVLALLAFAVRVPHLDQRPMHADEAMQAYLLGEILEGQGYHYSPQDQHGPAPLLLPWVIARLCGIRDFAHLNESVLRAAPVITGAFGVVLFALLIRTLGLLVASAGGLLWAINSLSVYYSRYFIHETLFVVATFGLILAGQRMFQERSLVWSLLVGMFLGLMLGCKETAVLSLIAIGLASGPWIKKELSAGLHLWSMALALLVAGVVFWSLYSWGGTNVRGPGDYLTSFGRFFARAAGEGHQKPPWYYLSLLGQGRGNICLFVLAIVGTVDAVRHRHDTVRFFSLFGLLTLVIYSLIPYKTPWLAMNFWLPLCLVAGQGVASLWRSARGVWPRIIHVLLASILIGLLGFDTWLRVFEQPADEHNPYAYAHPGSDILRLPTIIHLWAVEHGKNERTLRIAVVMHDAWPLPWYLRQYPLTGYWQPAQQPDPADLYLTAPEIPEIWSAKLSDWRQDFFGLRPEVLVVLWSH